MKRTLAGGLLLLAGCGQAPVPAVAPAAATPPAAIIATPSTAVHVSSVELGNALAADQRVLQPMIEFAPSDTFHATVTLAGHDAAVHRLGVEWTHLDSRQRVFAEHKLLSVAGNLATTFRLSKPDVWPPGQYRLQVMLDDHPVQARLFEVRAPAASVTPSASPTPAAAPRRDATAPAG